MAERKASGCCNPRSTFTVLDWYGSFRNSAGIFVLLCLGCAFMVEGNHCHYGSVAKFKGIW